MKPKTHSLLPAANGYVNLGTSRPRRTRNATPMQKTAAIFGTFMLVMSLLPTPAIAEMSIELSDAVSSAQPETNGQRLDGESPSETSAQSDGGSNTSGDLEPVSNSMPADVTETNGTAENKAELGALSIALELPNGPQEESSRQFLVAVRNAEGAFLNNAGEWVEVERADSQTNGELTPEQEEAELLASLDDSLKMRMSPEEPLELANIPVGTYRVTQLDQNREIDGWILDEDASVVDVEGVEVEANKTTDVKLSNAYVQDAEPEEQSEPEEPAANETITSEEKTANRNALSNKSALTKEAPATNLQLGSTNEEDNRQETTDLSLLLDSSKTKINGIVLGELEPGQKVPITKGEPFTIELHFADSSGDEGYYIKRDTESDPLTYELPEGLVLPEGYSFTFDLEVDEGVVVEGNTVVYEDGYLKVRWNKDSSNYDALSGAGELAFHLEFEATADENAAEIKFTDTLTVSLDQDVEQYVTVNKEGAYNNQTNKVEYQIEVVSYGENENVVITDSITGSALTYNNDLNTKDGTEFQPATAGDDVPKNGFKVTIPKMENKQKVVFTYTAGVTTEGLVSGVQNSQTAGNSVTVRSGDFTTNKTYVVPTIDWSNITKAADSTIAMGTPDDPNDETKRTVTWTITTNEPLIASLVGDTLTDKMGEGKDRMTYAGDGIHVKVTDKTGKSVERDVTWEKLKDFRQSDKWSYQFPEEPGLSNDKIYKYEITYKTVIDLTDTNKSYHFRNTADDWGGVAHGDVYVGYTPGRRIHYTKSVANATVEVSEADKDRYPAGYVDWDVVVHVPANSFGAEKKFTIVDYLPYKQEVVYDAFDSLQSATMMMKSGDTYAGDYEAQKNADGSYSFASTNEHFTVEEGTDDTNKPIVTFTFYKDGELQNTGLNAKLPNNTDMPERTIKLRIRTKNDPRWVSLENKELVTEETLRHINSVRVNGFDPEYAYAYPSRYLVEKAKVPEFEGGYFADGLPVYKFRIRLQGITPQMLSGDKTIEIGDAMTLRGASDSATKYFDYFVDADHPTTFAGTMGGVGSTASKGKQVSWTDGAPSGADSQLVVADDQDLSESGPKGITFTIQNLDGLTVDTVDSSGQTVQAAYGTYVIEYYVRMREDVLSAIDELSVKEYQEEKDDPKVESPGEVTFDNSLSGDKVVGKTKVDFDYTYEPVDKSVKVNKDTRTATYTIVLNKDMVKLNNGDTMEMTDTFSKNQSIMYDTITVKSAKKKVTAADGTVTYEEMPKDANWVSWDFSGRVGTFSIPDETMVEIEYQAHLYPGETYTNTASMAGYTQPTEDHTRITGSGGGSAKSYRIRLFKYEDKHMETGLSNVTFRLLNANGSPIVYKKGDKAGQEVQFTTDASGFAEIFLHMGRDGIALRKNRTYYLEEVAPLEGYKKDYVLYSFEIADDSDYSTLKYHNNDILKVRNLKTVAGLSIVKRFTGSAQNKIDKTETAIAIEFLKAGKPDIASNWTTLETLKYGVEGGGFESGTYTLPSEKYQKGTYRVTETSVDDATGVTRTTTYLVDDETTSTVHNGETDNGTSLTVEVPSTESHTVVVTNTYDEHAYDLTKVDFATGEAVAGAEFTAYNATSPQPVTTYTTNEDGTFRIAKTDGNGYDEDTLYYVMETAAAAGYVLPKESIRQKCYFYFSNTDKTWPGGIEAKNLSKGYASEELTNEPEQSTTAQVVAKKKDRRTYLKDKEFEFELVDAEGNRKGSTATAKSGQEAKFDLAYTTGDLDFDESTGTYKTTTFQYTLREVIPATAQAYNTDGTKVDGVTYGTHTGARDAYVWVDNGFTYDSAEVPVTVTVTKDEGDNTKPVEESGYGELSATVTYGTTGGSVPKFTNDYKAKGDAQLKVGKILDGMVINAGQFTFKLQPLPNAVVRDAQGVALTNPTLQVTNGTPDDTGKASAEFPQFHYTEEDVPGNGSVVYTYKIVEEISAQDEARQISQANVNDSKIIYAQVTLTDDREGHINTEVKYFSDANYTTELSDADSSKKDVAFVNRYRPKGSMQFKADKIFKDNYWPSGTTTYEFEAVSADEDAPSFTNATVTITPGAAGSHTNYQTTNGAVEFGIENLKARSGETTATGYVTEREFTYTVREVKHGTTTNGVTYTGATKTMRLKIRDNGNGAISVVGLTLDDENKLQSIANGDPLDVGSFQNTYDANGKAELKAQKIINGREEWKNDESYTFKITPKDGAPMPNAADNDGTITVGNTDTVVTVGTNKVSRSKTFGTISINLDAFKNASGGHLEAITYEYDINEVIPADAVNSMGKRYDAEGADKNGIFAKDGITYDGTTRTIRVTFADDGRGHINPTITDVTNNGSSSLAIGTNGTGTVAVTNNYRATGFAPIKVSKKLTNKIPGEDLKFTFKLTPVGNAPIRQSDSNTTLTERMATATIAANGTSGVANFGNLLFYDTDQQDRGKVYVYKIEEVSHSYGGIALEDPKAIYAKVDLQKADDLNGNLAPAVTYYSDQACTQKLEGANIAFTNKYWATGSLDLSATKSFADNYWPMPAGNRTYTVKIVGASGAPTFTDVTISKNGTSVTGGMASFTLAHLADSNAASGYAQSKTFTYDVYEYAPEPAQTFGVTYDTTHYTLELTLTDNGAGVIVPTYVIKDANGVDVTNSLTSSGFQFNNSYDAEGDGEIKVKKTLTGREWKNGESYTFKLTPKDGAPMPTVTNGTKNPDGSITLSVGKETASFGNIHVVLKDLVKSQSPATRTYEYELSEVLPTDDDLLTDGTQKDGVTYDAQPTRTIRLTFTDKGDGTITPLVRDATKNAGANDGVGFTNDYHSKGSAVLKAKKSFVKDGKAQAWPGTNALSFKLVGRNVNGVAGTNGQQTINNVADTSEQTFNTIQFTNEDLKLPNNTYAQQAEFEYKVTEVLPNGVTAANPTDSKGITYDTSTHRVTVRLTDNGNGAIATSYKWDGEDDWGNNNLTTITNSYDASTSVTLAGTKAIDVTSSSVSTEGFGFTLTAITKDGVTAHAGHERTGTSGTTGTFTLDPLAYTLDDLAQTSNGITSYPQKTFHYTLSENAVTKAGYSAPSSTASPIAVDVTVSYNAQTGRLEAVPTYKRGNETTSVRFTNMYEARTQVVIKGQKSIRNDARATNNQSLAGFQFQLYKNSVAEDNKIGTPKTTDDQGNFSFDAIAYELKAGTENTVGTQAQPHRYTYVIHELNKDGYVPQNQDFKVFVDVWDQGDGELHYRITDERNAPMPSDGFAMENVHEATGSLPLAGTKTIDNRNFKAGERYTFAVYELIDGERQETPVATGAATTPANQSKSAPIVFTPSSIPYVHNATKSDVKTHVYEVVETSTNGNGITTDKTVLRFNAKVEDAGTSTLRVTPGGSASPSALNFTNHYEASGTFKLQGTKAITNKPTDMDLAGFKFTVKDGNTEVATGTSKADGTIDFNTISYSIADLDQIDATTGLAYHDYTYTVAEDTSVTPKAGVLVNAQPVTITVRVSDQGNGHLKVTKIDGTSDPDHANFTNTYQAAGSLKLTATKKFADNTYWPTGTPSYTLQVANSTATNAPQFATTSGTATKDEPTVQFGTLSFSLANLTKVGDHYEDATYTYTVSEQAPTANNTKGVTYANAQTVTIRLHDEGDGTISATVNNQKLAINAKDPYNIDLINDYSASGTAEVKVTKSFGDQEWPGNQTFDFTLEPVTDGAPMPSGTKDDIKTVTDVAKGQTKGFGEMNYSWDKLTKQDNTGHRYGEFKYRVREVKPTNTKGVTYDESAHEVTVRVTDNGDGTTTTTYVNDKNAASDTVTITNSYAAETAVTLAGAKDVDVSDISKAGFTFALHPAQGNPRTGDADSATSGSNGAFSFKELTYTLNDLKKAGTNPVEYETSKTFSYTISENDYSTMENKAGFKQNEKPAPIDVTVTLAFDSNAGTLTATRTYQRNNQNVDAITFANKYHATATLPLAGTKTIDKRDVKNGDTFTFEVREQGENGKVYVGTATYDADKTHGNTTPITFAPITYTYDANTNDLGNHTYVACETAATADGVTKSSKTYEFSVNVTDDGSGTLHLAKEGDNTQALNFTNEYRATGSVLFAGTKRINKRNIKPGETFSFEVCEGDTVVARGTSDANGNITYGSAQSTISYQLNKDRDDTGLHTYTVRETLITPNGSARDGVTRTTTEHTVTVLVADNHNGTLSATASDNATALNFVNAYEATGQTTFAGTKSIDTRDLVADDVFNFTIVEKNGDLPTGRTWHVSSDGTGKINYPTITYDIAQLVETEATSDLPGIFRDSRVFTYEITEDNTNRPGVTKSNATTTTTVTVTDNKNGTLAVAPAAGSSALSFQNHYEATGQIELTGTKTIEGREFQDGDTWTFTVTADDTAAPMPEHTSVTIRPTSGASTQLDFGTISYTQADAGKTYTYTIAESGTVAGVRNAGAQTVTVTVTDNATSELTVQSSTDTTPLVFANDYDATGETTLVGTKTIAGREFRTGDQWTFAVTGSAGAPMPERPEVTIEPTSGTSANLDFGKIAYTEAHVGNTYTYTIRESGSGAGVTNDAQKIVTVSVSDNGNGTLAVTNSSKNEQTPLTFSNTYHAQATTVLRASKALVGRSFQANDTWTFTVSADDGVPMPAYPTVTIQPTSGNTAPVEFGTITYTQDDFANVARAADGTRTREFVYTIAETGEVTSVANATAQTVTVTAVDDGEGHITVANTTASTPTVFTNTYTAQGQTELTGTKTITGREFLTGDTWTFLVTADDAQAPLPEHSEVTITPAEGTSAQLDFGTISYTQADAGKTYTYTITETGEVAGVTNAGDQQVTVHVSDNGDGTLAITNSSTNEQTPLVFANTYQATGSTTLKVHKSLVGRDFQSGDVWNFTVVANDEHAPMPSLAELTLNAHSAQTLDFGTINYTQADAGKTYTYTIAETGEIAGVTNDASKTVTVTVEDNGDGTLRVTNSEAGNNNTVAFANNYAAQTSIALAGTKTIDVRSIQAGETFTFRVDELKANNERVPVQTVVLSAEQVAQSADIPYQDIEYVYNKDARINRDDRGVHTYEVTETATTAAGVTVSTAKHTFVVEVTDVMDGSRLCGELQAELTRGDPTNLDFTNAYQAKGQTIIAGTKTIDADARANTSLEGMFTFELYAGTKAEGEPLQSKTTNARGEFTFDPLTYEYSNSHKDLDAAGTSKTYTYTVHEKAKPGYRTSDQTVVVTVADTNSGDLTVTSDVPQGGLTFANTHEATGSLTLAGTKTINTRALHKNETYEFVLEETFTNVAGNEQKREDRTFTNGEDGAINFPTLTYVHNKNQSDVGTHAYRVYEKANSGKGITTPSASRAFTVTVTDEGTNELKVEYTGDDPAKLDFVNHYEAAGKARLGGTKAIEGRTFKQGDSATFKIEALTKGAPLPAQTEVTVRPTEGRSVSYAFGDIAYDLSNLDKGEDGYTKSTTFEYKVTESACSMVGVAGPDATEHTVTVTVEDNGDGTLKVEPSANASALDFTNTYEATGQLELKGTKRVDARDFHEGDSATFKIEALTKGAPLPAQTEVTVRPTEGRSVSYAFGNIAFQLSHLADEDGDGNADQKTFEYKVTESACSMAGVAGPDATEHTVTVTVEDNGDGTLKVEPSANASVLDFTNTYEATGSVTIHGTKTIDVDKRQNKDFAGKFTFKLYAGNKVEGEPLQTVTTKADQTFAFSAINYELKAGTQATVGTQAKPKVYTYTLHEDAADGYEPVEDQLITVSVWDDGTGALHTNVEGMPANGFTLENRHTATAKLQLAGLKTINTRKLQEGETYEFVLTDVFGGSEQVVGRYHNNKAGTIDFPELSYDLSDVGTHAYKVTETVKDGDGITTSRASHEFEVTVTDEGTSKLGVAYSEADGQTLGHLNFQNEYEASGTLSLSGTKTIANKPASMSLAGFTFSVKNEAGNEVATGESDASGRITFTGISFTMEDLKNADGAYVESKDFTYTVTETGAGTRGVTKAGVTNSDASVVVKVTVADDHKGHLTFARAEGSSVGLDAVDFRNSYSASGTAEIHVAKELRGRGWQNGDSFSFTLEAQGDAPMPEGAADGKKTVEVTNATEGHAAGFGAITYTKAGTYRYTVKEVRGTLSRMAYETDEHTVTIEVVDDGMGNIVAKAGSSLEPTETFVNTYTPHIPSFQKQVADVNDSETSLPGEPVNIDEGAWQDVADYDIGDAVPYRLTAILPDDVTLYGAYHIVFEDQMEEALDFNDDIQVRITKDGNVIATEYAVQKAGERGDHGFTYALAWGGDTGKQITEDLNGATVELFYTATLNNSASLGTQGNVNGACLRYANDPMAEGGGEAKLNWDYAIVFTYGLSINKVDDQSGDALEGAEFKLEKKLVDGKTKEIAKDAAGSTGSTFSFKGLDDGTYVLTEAKRPDGTKAIDPITFRVEAGHVVSWENEAEGCGQDFVAGTAADHGNVLQTLTGNVESGVVYLPGSYAEDADPQKGMQDSKAEGTLAGDVVNELVGSVQIQKTFAGLPEGFNPAAGFDDGSKIVFAIALDYDADGMADKELGPIPYSDFDADGTYTIDELPIYTIVTAEELIQDVNGNLKTAAGHRCQVGTSTFLLLPTTLTEHETSVNERAKTQAMTFENEYTEEGLGSLRIKKRVDSSNEDFVGLMAKTIYFVVRDANGNEVGRRFLADFPKSTTNADGSTESEWLITNLPEGDYTVTEGRVKMDETGGISDTVAYEGQYNVTNKTTTVEREKVAEYSISNTYNATSTNIDLSVTKELKGDVSAYKGDEEFVFTLSKAGVPTDEATHTEPTVIINPNTNPVTIPGDALSVEEDANVAAVKVGENKAFGTISYSETGTYYYRIDETPGDTAGMGYADTTYVRVDVVDDSGTPVVFWASGQSLPELQALEATTLDEHVAQLVEQGGAFHQKSATDPAANAITVTNTYTDTTPTPEPEPEPEPSQETGTLTVKKVVKSSRAADKKAAYGFEVTLGSKLSGRFGKMEFTDGVATFKLADGQSIKASGLPLGITYTVRETSTGGLSSSFDKAKGSVGKATTVTCTNVYERKTPQTPGTSGSSSATTGASGTSTSGGVAATSSDRSATPRTGDATASPLVVAIAGAGLLCAAARKRQKHRR